MSGGWGGACGPYEGPQLAGSALVHLEKGPGSQLLDALLLVFDGHLSGSKDAEDSAPASLTKGHQAPLTSSSPECSQ